MTTNITVSLDSSQHAAVNLITTARIGIVTGGPGTGKTTCLGHALDVLDAAGTKYELAAPTGKAARRMLEATGREARTIHRLLEWRGTWQRHRLNPLGTDVVIIDESSMIDIELFAALLDAIDPEHTRLILIGDADQLPPVGPGRPFGDLVDHALVPIARLTTLHRSAQDSWVCANAPRVLAGELPTLGTQPDFEFVDVPDAADIMPAVRAWVTEHLPRKAGAGDAQVLIPQRKGVAGVQAANALLQAAHNPPKPDAPWMKLTAETTLRAGDRVIHTRNDYDLGVFNGEVGEVVSIAGGKVSVDLGRDAGPVVYTLEQAHALQHAYALTVHRAQGSEFPWVIVVCHSTHSHSLSRQLFYTAITRGKRGVVLVGNRTGVRLAINANRPPQRNTTLAERIRGTL